MSRRHQPTLRRGGHSREEVAQLDQIRRAQVSFGLIWASESAFMVGLGVVAFRAGGVGAVGIVTAARMAAAALLAPLLATVADRVRRERVLTCVGLVRAATLGGARRSRPRAADRRDVRPGGRRHGRAGAVPAGALGPAARAVHVPAGS
jgi:hypothetical protein